MVALYLLLDILSLNYQFSKQKASNLNSSSNQPIPLFKEPSKKEINIVSTAETTTISVKSKNSGWVVQLGAFSKKENALAKLKEIQMQFSTNTYQLIYYKKLFRVISKKFKEKAAVNTLLIATLQKNIEGYIIFIPDRH